MSNYILAIDQGTTGTKVLVMDLNLNPIAEASTPFEQHFPQPGWVEHDLKQIWESVCTGIKSVSTQADLKKVVSIGITNQRETICFWDKKSGEPLSRAIVWQDRRTAAFCENLKAKNLEKFYTEHTGLLLDPYFSGSKVGWALKNNSNIQNALKNKVLAIGTIDSYLLFKLTGNTIHATEPSNASRTLCFDIHKHHWSSELCLPLEVPLDIWPEVKTSMGYFGKTKSVPALPNEVPITGILGDQQSALLGQACIEVGSAKCTYGTGAFLLMNTGSSPIFSKHRLLTTIAWSNTKNEFTYALEGSAFIAGAAIQWARDGLKLIKKSSDIETLAKTVSSSEGVVFVPSLTGLGAPYWDPNATGLLSGITRGSTNGHIARAILEGVAFQNADLLFTMEKDLDKPLPFLNVDGGACKNNLLMQFQSDILNVEIKRPVLTETTSLGAIFAAGMGAKIWKDFSEIKQSWKQEKIFIPSMNSNQREIELKKWHTAIKRVLVHA